MSAPSDAVLDWLDRLVRLDSTSRVPNTPVIDLLAGHARSLGLTPLVFPREDGQRANMVVTVPDADGGTSGGVMLSGHTDCVPVDGQQWSSDPFRVDIRDGRAYGRGTADMKGFVALMAAVLPDATHTPLREPLHLAFSYDEEVGCLGAPPLVASLADAGIAPRACFVGEPTSMRMIRAHKSINVVTVTVTGLNAHSSLTAHGVNAVEYGAEVIRYWREQADRWRSEGPWDEAYPVPWTTGSVNVVRGGTAPNIVPDRCEITAEFRAIAAVDDRAVVDGLRRFCRDLEQRMRAEHDVARVNVAVDSMTPGLDTPPTAAVVELGARLGLPVSGDKVTYGTEAGVFSDAGIPTVVCGPGDIAQAHKADEFVELDQLAHGEAFLGRLLGSLRGGDRSS